jgi:thiamine biosynthesis lipoprotein
MVPGRSHPARPHTLSRRALFGSGSSASRRKTDFWIRVHRAAMACRFEIVLPGEDSRHLAAARHALDEADRIEAMLTVFRDTSEVADLNRRAADTPHRISQQLFDLLLDCRDLYRATDGAFDITSTPLSRCWGFLRRAGRVPTDADIESARACVGAEHLVLDPDTRSVQYRRRGLEVNFGAIGKGYALDRMAIGLAASGVDTALLSAGQSSVLARGSGWLIDIRSATRGDCLAHVHLRDGALGTSGAGEQFIEVEGVRYGHVIDPRTGRPASGVLSASVLASSAAEADALSTAFLVGGVDLARRYCRDHHEVLALITPDNGRRRPVLIGSFSGAVVNPL